MIDLDGSQGEGGGQILRTALSLSLITRIPFRLHDIRAGRERPGLAPQHLACVLAAAAIGRARLEDAKLRSERITFVPAGLVPGRYRFDIDTAGATGLLSQTVLLPLALAGSPSEVLLTGGSHVPHSPTFHYLERCYLPALAAMGLAARAWLPAAGFYPRGGGRVRCAVEPLSRPLAPLDWRERGAVLGLSGLSLIAGGLPGHIAQRQKRRAEARLAGHGPAADIELAELPALDRGTMLLLCAAFSAGRACATALGERGKPAERVADEAADELLTVLGGGASVDDHLSDQLLLPMALAAGTSHLRLARVTRHFTTNAKVIKAFLPAVIELEGRPGGPILARVKGTGQIPLV
jgi:RNA 3'-terminal phosphate cyclase (ATP)